jgi:hypothetical protein
MMETKAKVQRNYLKWLRLVREALAEKDAARRELKLRVARIFQKGIEKSRLPTTES